MIWRMKSRGLAGVSMFVILKNVGNSYLVVKDELIELVPFCAVTEGQPYFAAVQYIAACSICVNIVAAFKLGYGITLLFSHYRRKKTSNA
ncbi:hypothetical protein GMJAKD_13825 [Candidatus Electrothrix aarhusensis]